MRAQNETMFDYENHEKNNKIEAINSIINCWNRLFMDFIGFSICS